MRKRVLVVDDEPDVVTYICSILEDNGFETATAADGEEAMKKVLEQRPDCVTLDISMPHTRGKVLQVAKRKPRDEGHSCHNRHRHI